MDVQVDAWVCRFTRIRIGRMHGHMGASSCRRGREDLDVWGYLLCFWCGALVALMGQRLRRKTPAPQAQEELSPRMKQQFDNFLSYDGTATGQHPLQDGKDYL